jgi:hypothetical protein
LTRQCGRFSVSNELAFYLHANIIQDPLYHLLRNPVVHVEDWLQPDSEESDADADADESDGEEPVDGEEDPQFEERMAPLGLNAVDEPEVGHDELAAFLEENLYFMDEDEWLDICKSCSQYY